MRVAKARLSDGSPVLQPPHYAVHSLQTHFYLSKSKVQSESLTKELLFENKLRMGCNPGHAHTLRGLWHVWRTKEGGEGLSGQKNIPKLFSKKGHGHFWCLQELANSGLCG